MLFVTIWWYLICCHPLPKILSRLAMTVGRDEIPKQDVERWSHLEGHVYLTDLNMDLLIGADVPETLQLREIIPAADRGPYATRVDLGLVVNGLTMRKQNCMYLTLDSSLRLRRFTLCLQLLLISWMHLTPMV